MDNWFDEQKKRRNSIEKSWQSEPISAAEDIEKARKGTYKDNAQNRKKGVVGMPYGKGNVGKEGVVDTDKKEFKKPETWEERKKDILNRVVNHNDKAYELVSTSMYPISSQLQAITGDSYNSQDFHNVSDKNKLSSEAGNVIVHKKTGKMFKMPAEKQQEGKKSIFSANNVSASLLKDAFSYMVGQGIPKDLKGNVTFKVDARDIRGMRPLQDKFMINIYQDGKVVGNLGTVPSKIDANEFVQRELDKLQHNIERNIERLSKYKDSWKGLGYDSKNQLLSDISSLKKKFNKSEIEIIEKAFDEGKISEDLLLKSWSTDLQKKHAGSSWKTIKGARILVGSGGEILASNKELKTKLENKKSSTKDSESNSEEKFNGSYEIKSHKLTNKEGTTHSAVVYADVNGKQKPIKHIPFTGEDNKSDIEKRAKQLVENWNNTSYREKLNQLHNISAISTKELKAKLESKKSGGKDSYKKDKVNERTEKLLKEYYNKDKGSKEKIVKMGVTEKSAIITAKKLGKGYEVKPDTNEKGKFTVIHSVPGDAEGLTFQEYKDKYAKQLAVTAKNQIEYEGQQTSKENSSKKEFSVDSKYTKTEFNDSNDISKLKTAIREGLGYLKSGKSPSGKKMVEGQKEAIKTSIENATKKIDALKQPSKGESQEVKFKDITTTRLDEIDAALSRAGISATPDFNKMTIKINGGDKAKIDKVLSAYKGDMAGGISDKEAIDALKEFGHKDPTNAMIDKQKRSMADSKKRELSEDDKKYFKENKSELMAELDDDPLLSFKDAIKEHQSKSGIAIIEKAFSEGRISDDLMIKSWSTDLQKKHAGSAWKTIKGARILVGSGGEILASNKELKAKLDSKKSGGASSAEFSKKELATQKYMAKKIAETGRNPWTYNDLSDSAKQNVQKLVGELKSKNEEKKKKLEAMKNDPKVQEKINESGKMFSHLDGFSTKERNEIGDKILYASEKELKKEKQEAEKKLNNLPSWGHNDEKSRRKERIAKIDKVLDAYAKKDSAKELVDSKGDSSKKESSGDIKVGDRLQSKKRLAGKKDIYTVYEVLPDGKVKIQDQYEHKFKDEINPSDFTNIGRDRVSELDDNGRNMMKQAIEKLSLSDKQVQEIFNDVDKIVKIDNSKQKLEHIAEAIQYQTVEDWGTFNNQLNNELKSALAEDNKKKHKVFDDKSWQQFKLDGLKSKIDRLQSLGKPVNKDLLSKVDKAIEDSAKEKPKASSKAPSKMSDSAKAIKENSKQAFLKESDPKKLQSMLDQVKGQLGVDEQGKKNIGMGLDEDMVAAAKAFLSDKDVNGHIDFMTKELKEPKQFTPKQETPSKPKKVSDTVSNKKIKDIDSFAKQKLDPETNETIGKLQNLASKIDEKYLSTATKDKLNGLVKEVYENAYTGSRDISTDKLDSAKNIKESLAALKTINTKLQKEDSYTIEEETVDKIQEVLVTAAKEQLQKKTTEKLNYKIF